jgi:hypothetical protein
MNVRQFNWPVYVGFLFVLIAVFSYPAVFVWSPVTRDFPWVNLLLFVVALFFVWKGIRRGFARDRKHPAVSKVVTSIEPRTPEFFKSNSELLQRKRRRRSLISAQGFQPWDLAKNTICNSEGVGQLFQS